MLGVGFTVSTATYALAQLPSGVLGGPFGDRRVVRWALAGTAVGSLLLALSTSAALLVGWDGALALLAATLALAVGALLVNRTFALGY